MLLLAREPADRPHTMAAVLGHPFFDAQPKREAGKLGEGLKFHAFLRRFPFRCLAASAMDPLRQSIHFIL